MESAFIHDKIKQNRRPHMWFPESQAKSPIPLFTEKLKLDEGTEVVNIYQMNMSADVFQHLMEQFTKCRNLKKFTLTDVSVNDDQDDIIHRMFSNHPGLPHLTDLTLGLENMSNFDIETLFQMVRYKMARLRELQLSSAKLTDKLELLLNRDSSFHCLQVIKLLFTELSHADLCSLSTAVAEGKLPKLKVLSVANNKLTGYLWNLFKYTEFPRLENLDLSETQLNKADIKSLGTAFQIEKLLQLKNLELSGNNLTDSMQDLLGDVQHTGLSSLQTLGLVDIYLTESDIEALCQGYRSGKLRNLKTISLSPISLSERVSIKCAELLSMVRFC